jgi:hypothetical protein
MITPEQIPDEVVEAAAVAAYETLRPRKWEKAGYINQQQCRRDARAAIAAALAAWPGMSVAPIPSFRPYKEAETLQHIILPLT